MFQDAHEREYINCDKYLEQIFGCQRMKFAEIPQRLNPLLHPPDPIVINHVIRYVPFYFLVTLQNVKRSSYTVVAGKCGKHFLYQWW